MSRRRRLLLALLGLLLIILSLALLLYAFWPLELDLSRVRLPPDLFRPPEAALWRGGVL